MNYGLAKDLYGSFWSVDFMSANHLSSLLYDLRSNIKLEVPEHKYNSISCLINSETIFISNPKELNDINGDFNGIGIININGPITKSGGQSSYGMSELSEMMISMAKDDRIKGFIEINDSGGGQTSAVDIMLDAKELVKDKYNKPIYSFIPKGGMSNSAMYGIASGSDGIYSESEMNLVGGAGTLIEIKQAPNGSIDSNGQKTLRIYASKSMVGKNKGFEEAINNDNFEIIQNDLLNPINEHFLSRIINNRPILKNSDYEDGKTYFSKDVVGTFIDGIASFDEVVQMVLNDSKNYKSSTNISLIKNSKKMTKEELKNSHPEIYSSIVNEGVNSERERVKSWMVFANADLDAVTNGVNSGETISPSEMVKLTVKMNSTQMLDNLKSDSTPPVLTEETPTVVKPDVVVGNGVDEATSFYKSLIK